MPNFVSGEIQAAALNTTAGAPSTTTFPMNGRISRATAKKEKDEETVSYLDYRGSEYPRLTGNWYHYNTLFNGQFGDITSSLGPSWGQDTWGPSDIFYFKDSYWVFFRPARPLTGTNVYNQYEGITTTTSFVNGAQASTFTLPGTSNYNLKTLIRGNTTGGIDGKWMPLSFLCEFYMFGSEYGGGLFTWQYSPGQPGAVDSYLFKKDYLNFYKVRYSPERLWAIGMWQVTSSNSTYAASKNIVTSTTGAMGSYTFSNNTEDICWFNGFQKYLNGYCITAISDIKANQNFQSINNLGKYYLHSTDAGIPAPTAANQGVNTIVYNQNNVNPWVNGNVGYAYSSDYGVTWKKVIYPTKGLLLTLSTGAKTLQLTTYFSEIVYNDYDKRYYMMESHLTSNDHYKNQFVFLNVVPSTETFCRIHYASSLDGPWSNYQIENLSGRVTGFSYVGNGRLVISLGRSDVPTNYNSVYYGTQQGFQASKRKAGFATAVGAGTLSASGWGSYDIKTFSSLYTNSDTPFVHTMTMAPAWNGVTSVICGYQLEMDYSTFQTTGDATRLTASTSGHKWRPFIFTTNDWSTFTEQLPDDGNVGDPVPTGNNPRAFAKVNFAGGKFFIYNLDYEAWYGSYNSSREWGGTWRQNTLTWSG